MNSDITTTRHTGEVAVRSTEDVTFIDIRNDSQTYPRIGSFTREQAVYEMSKIVMNAFMYRGQRADQTNVQFIACALVDELQKDDERIGTKYISFAEISRVVKRAVLGGSDMFGISVASIYKVIVDYVKGEGHLAEVEVAKRRQRADREAMDNSPVMTMIRARAGMIGKDMKRR